MNDALFLLRLMTIFVCAVAFGLSVVALYYYIRNRHNLSRMLPIENEQVALLAIAYIGAIASGIANIIDSILQNEHFNWYESPLMLLSMAAGAFGLTKLVLYERRVQSTRKQGA